MPLGRFYVGIALGLDPPQFPSPLYHSAYPQDTRHVHQFTLEVDCCKELIVYLGTYLTDRHTTQMHREDTSGNVSHAVVMMQTLLGRRFDVEVPRRMHTSTEPSQTVFCDSRRPREVSSGDVPRCWVLL